MRSLRSSAFAVLFSILLAGGVFGLAFEAPAEERGVGGGRALVPETPLSPEAAAAVQSVLQTLRSRPPATGQPIAALALEVSRSPDLVLEALAQTRAGKSASARAALSAHARRIVELRAAAAASKGPAGGGRAADAQAGPYLDELVAALTRAGSEGQQSGRERELMDLIERMQSGDLPVRQPYVDDRSPTIRWLHDEPGSKESASSEAAQFGSDAEQAEEAGR